MIQFYFFDLETMKNCFLFSGKFLDDTKVYTFEISDRMNQRNELLAHLNWLMGLRDPQGRQTVYMVGYNSLDFDYRIIHDFLSNPYMFTVDSAYNKAQEIIQGQNRGFKTQPIWERDRYIPQICLLKMNHFDNASRRTSLKSLQFAMRSESVEDLPFEHNTPLTFEQMDIMRSYNAHDLTETEAFFKKCKKMIDMRRELLETGAIDGDVYNFSDVKIGYTYLIKQIGKSKCFNGSKPKQTIRPSVRLSEIIVDIPFLNADFQAVVDWFKSLIIYPVMETKPSFETELNGIHFKFGLGGIHASVTNSVFEANDKYTIEDVDVSGMYPRIADVLEIEPEHLKGEFIKAYRQLPAKRKLYPKKSAWSEMLKLAQNGGGFGKMNDVYSCFFDTKAFYSVTINGQIMLFRLIEMLMMIPGVQIIQANTDGVTAKVNTESKVFFDLACEVWQQQTRLELERVQYKKMIIRDVNSYIAVDINGKTKRKGAYWFPDTEDDYNALTWPKDFSAIAIQRAASLVLVDGWSPEAAVMLNVNPFDFMLRYKATGDSKVYIGEKQTSKTVRYYITTNGEPMKKVFSPKGIIGQYCRKNKITDSFYLSVLKSIPEGAWDERIHTKNKSRCKMKETGIDKGYLVKCCNVAKMFDWVDINYQYYIDEVNKLTNLGDHHDRTNQTGIDNDSEE